MRPGNSERLAHRLDAHGSRVTLQSYPRTDHLTLIGSFAPLVRLLAPVVDDVTDFIRRLPPTTGAR